MITDAHVHLWRLARGDNVALSPVDDGDLPRLRARGPAAASSMRRASNGSSSCRRRRRWPRRCSPSGSRPQVPWIAGVVGWIDPASPSVARGSRCAVVASGGQGRPAGQRRQPLHRLDARCADRALGWKALAECGLLLDFLVQNPREVPLASSRRAPSRAFDRPRPLRQARHRRWPLRAMGGSHRRARRPAPCLLQALGPAQLCRTRCRRADLEPYAEPRHRELRRRRVIWASDWPPLDLASDYATWWQVSLDVLASLNEKDRAEVLSGNAITHLPALGLTSMENDAMSQKLRIGFIGVGLMGHGAAKQHHRERRLSAHHSRPPQPRAGRRSRRARRS